MQGVVPASPWCHGNVGLGKHCVGELRPVVHCGDSALLWLLCADPARLLQGSLSVLHCLLWSVDLLGWPG